MSILLKALLEGYTKCAQLTRPKYWQVICHLPSLFLKENKWKLEALKSPVSQQTVKSSNMSVTWAAKQTDSAALRQLSLRSCAALCRPIPLQGKPCSLFFIGKGIWLLSSGSRPLSNTCLACKQAAGSAPSSSQCVARPSWVEGSCDTDPTPSLPASLR